MRIAVDAMGGDHAPGEIVRGAVDAVQHAELQVLLVGPQDVIERELQQYHYPSGAITVVQASEVIGMNEHPAQAVRHKKDASLLVATRLVKEQQADAIISAGNTGAQMAAALFILGRIPGIERPAIATVIPTPVGPKVLLDSGANLDVKPEQLCQFALLGSIYAEQGVGIKQPRVALINVGSELNKGNQVVQETYRLLQQDGRINFAGNVEGRELFTTEANVLVCDGFVGNVILKLTEGLVATLLGMIKDEIKKNPIRMLGGMLVKPGMRAVYRQLDYTEYGGAPLLGVQGISLICHGSSRAQAIKNAITSATEFVRKDFLGKVLAQLEGND